MEGRDDIVPCYEIKILSGLCGPVNMHLAFTKNGKHFLDLVNQMDGQGHVEDDHATGNVSVQRQQQIDANFDLRCWSLNMQLLRPYWRHTEQYNALISTAVQHSKDQPFIR